MKGYLLDTCALVWYFTGSRELPAALHEALVDTHNRVCASDVSSLELVIKHSLGKISLPQPPSVWLPVLTRKHLLESLPLDAAAIFRLEGLPWLHRDPFDRLLVAQALTQDLTLVTPDPLIQQYPVSWTW